MTSGLEADSEPEANVTFVVRISSASEYPVPVLGPCHQEAYLRCSGVSTTQKTWVHLPLPRRPELSLLKEGEEVGTGVWPSGCESSHLGAGVSPQSRCHSSLCGPRARPCAKRSTFSVSLTLHANNPERPFQLRKRRLREIRWLVQSHTACKEGLLEKTQAEAPEARGLPLSSPAHL